MTDGDVDAVAAANARAFFDDPLQVWALPDASTRLGKLEQMFALQTRVATLRIGEAYTDDTCSVAAFWAPPGKWEPPAEIVEELTPLRSILAEGLGRFLIAMHAMHEVHPEEPHWYLQGLGTDPPRQGQGLASAALGPVLARCDAEGVPAYLESTKERNIGFYEQHGFAVVGCAQIPLDGPPLWLMWRAPR
jgi:GNAT superfamily N-acetyltransferase